MEVFKIVKKLSKRQPELVQFKEGSRDYIEAPINWFYDKKKATKFTGMFVIGSMFTSTDKKSFHINQNCFSSGVYMDAQSANHIRSVLIRDNKIQQALKTIKEIAD